MRILVFIFLINSCDFIKSDMQNQFKYENNYCLFYLYNLSVPGIWARTIAPPEEDLHFG